MKLRTTGRPLFKQVTLAIPGWVVSRAWEEAQKRKITLEEELEWVLDSWYGGAKQKAEGRRKKLRNRLLARMDEQRQEEADA